MTHDQADKIEKIVSQQLAPCKLDSSKIVISDKEETGIKWIPLIDVFPLEVSFDFDKMEVVYKSEWQEWDRDDLRPEYDLAKLRKKRWTIQ